MPKTLFTHAAERIDQVDFDYISTHSRELVKLYYAKQVLDKQARYISNFRVELPDQTAFPGRIIIHAGAAFAPNGQISFNEDQLDVSRTITLEGASTTFYIEIEFTEANSDIDARGFWDPTIPNANEPSGDPSPSGQEIGNTVATRKTPDWKIVLPISTTGFDRDINFASNRIPLIRLITDASNRILLAVNPNLLTEKPATTLLEVVSTTILRVQNSQMFPASSDIIVGQGAGSQEIATISSVDRATGRIVLTGALANVHSTGEIIRGSGVNSPDIITEADFGRYRRVSVSNPIDFRDFTWQGDEIHGDILTKGHNSANLNERADRNLIALKDYVDFLSAQVQELKWGITNPYTSMTDSVRTPPGLAINFPTTPRYFDRAGGVAGGRALTVSVGNGTTSFGDFNGTTGTAIQAAISALPTEGGIVYLKRGTYTLSSNINLNKNIVIYGDGPETNILCSGGSFRLNIALVSVAIRNLDIDSGTSNTGLLIDVLIDRLELSNVNFSDVSVDLNAALPESTLVEQCIFKSVSEISGQGLIRTLAANANIRGTFINCLFSHSTAVANGTCIDAGRTFAAGLVNCRFIGCRFEIKESATDTIFWSGTTEEVLLDHCSFKSLGSGLAYHIATSGGSRIAIRDCVVIDSDAGFINLKSVFDSSIKGLTQDSSTGPINKTVILLRDCTDILIEDCFVKGQVTSTSFSIGLISIKTESGLGQFKGYTITNCSFEDTSGSADKAVGIFIDTTGGISSPGIANLLISNNFFINCEIGIAFKNSIAGTYKHINIENNIFDGKNSNGKLGIFGGPGVSEYSNFNICDNQFVNLNAGSNTEAIAGTGRAAIYFSETVTSFLINSNIIRNLGFSGTTIVANGIFFPTTLDTTISSNKIEDLNGTLAYGIALGTAGFGTSRNTTVNDNYISGLTASTIIAAGISWDNPQFALSISGNSFRSITLSTAIAAVCIFSQGSSNADGLVITGNIAQLDDDDVTFIRLFGTDYNGVSISVNSVFGSFANGIKDGIAIEASTSAKAISIVGNSVINYRGRGISIDPQGTGVVEVLSISGNTIRSFNNTAVGYGIYLSDTTFYSINGNVIYSFSTANDNIFVTTSTIGSIATNVVRLPNSAVADNIHITSTGNIYNIQANVCDGDFASGGESIDTSQPAAGGGLIIDNLIDDNIPTLRAGDNTAATFPFNQNY